MEEVVEKRQLIMVSEELAIEEWRQVALKAVDGSLYGRNEQICEARY